MLFQSKTFFTPVKIATKKSIYVIGITILSFSLVSCGGKEKAQQPQTLAVKLKTLESDSLIDSAEYVGRMEATDRVSLAPRTEGRIIEIFVNRGDRVSQGQPVVKLEPTQAQEDVNAATQAVNVERARLGESQAEFKTAEANRAAAAAEVESARANLDDARSAKELAKTNIERTKMLVEGGALAQQELDNDKQELKSSTALLNSQQETLNAAVKSLEAAERQVEQAQANISRQEAAIGQAEAELGSTNQSLAFNTINAPIDGVVGSFDDKKVGDYVSVGEELTTITSNNNLDLNINIPVENRDRLKPGLVVETISQDGSSGTEGKISYIAPLVQQNTQSVLAKATFPNSNSIKDREYVRVRVIWDEEPGVLVPTTAISTLGGQNFVYVAKPQSESESQSQPAQEVSNNSPKQSGQKSSGNNGLIAEQQPVKLGKIQGQSYQIESGLKAGDRIAVSNILSLRDGAEIKPAE